MIRAYILFDGEADPPYKQATTILNEILRARAAGRPRTAKSSAKGARQGSSL
jgi:hypothetical protein